MCTPGAAGYYHRVVVRQMKTKARGYLAEDGYGFLYRLFVTDDQDIVEVCKECTGHNHTKLHVIISLETPRNPDDFSLGLQHVDESWKKRVFGKLYFVKTVRDWSLGIMVAKEKVLFFEGTLDEAENKKEKHWETLDQVYVPYGFDECELRWEECAVLPASQG